MKNDYPFKFNLKKNNSNQYFLLLFCFVKYKIWMVENIDFIMNSFESKELIIVTTTENELNDSYYFFDHNVNKSQNQAISINQNFVEFKLAKLKKI